LAELETNQHIIVTHQCGTAWKQAVPRLFVCARFDCGLTGTPWRTGRIRDIETVPIFGVTARLT
jgi:hypothetical protein